MDETTSTAVAPTATSANGSNKPVEESSEAIYARNRAIYEASLKQPQEDKEASTSTATTGSTAAEPNGESSVKQSRPREEDDTNRAAETGSSSSNIDTNGQPSKKKKLIRAGDVAAASSSGSQAPVVAADKLTESQASTAVDANTAVASDAGDSQTQVQSQEASNKAEPPQSAGTSTGAAVSSATTQTGESMREKLARAGRSTSGSPFIAQPPFSPSTNSTQTQPQLQQQQQMTGSVNLANPASSIISDPEQALEVNALAFIAKNPHVNPNFVRQALRHSNNQFDQNFQTALELQQAQSKATSMGGNGSMSPSGGGGVQGRYPGQTGPPVNGANYPGSRMSPSAAPQALHPHQMQGPGATGPAGVIRTGAGSPPGKLAQLAGAINGQSTASLASQTQIAEPPIPPPPILVGTHPAIGFSALQVLPQMQHQQYYALSPAQQTDYSMQVFKSLGQEQQANFTKQWRESEALRLQWNQYTAQTGKHPVHAGAGPQGTINIPPRGAPGNPYVNYSTQAPTAQQQMQQTRFPGQNPVFRVGAQGQQAQGSPSPGGSSAGPANQPVAGQSLQQNVWFNQQKTILLERMSPEARQKFHALGVTEQYNYVLQLLQMRQEAQKRHAQQSQRQKQQKVMADSHKAAKDRSHHTSSAAAAASAGTSAAAGGVLKKKKKKGGNDDSEDSEALGLHDDDTDDERDDDDAEDDDGSEAEAMREEKALVWFNEAKPEDIIEMTACSIEAANAVVEMRPYSTPGDARGKLRKRKGVSGNLFDNYVDLMHSYAQTDECLEKCQEIGQELLEVMKIWTGGKKIDPTPSMRPSAEPEEAKIEDGKDVKPEASIKVEAGATTETSGDIKVDIKEESEKKLTGALLTVPGAESSTATPLADEKPDISEAPSPDGSVLTAENTANLGSGLVGLSDEVLEDSKKSDASDEIKKAFEDYIYTQPKLLADNFKLKGYQMLGVNWLNMLYRKNISCILADEMGLGKTAQVIALIAHLKEKEKPGPHLVIVPSSTLDNWIREFDKFAPTLKVFAYYGSQLERADSRFFLKQQKDLDVIVTTYNMATGAPDDKKFLKKMEFKACVFDEGHQLKNAESKKYKDLMEIKVQWRLLLTGTPLQNNLQELVSLLSFILPKIFLEAQESLRAIFKVPPEAQKNLLTRQRVRAAKQVMTPFVLRRKKAQVLQDLPAKRELVEYCDMTATQRDIYRETLAKHKKAVVDYQPSGTNTPAEEPKPKKRGRAAAKTGKPAVENTTSNILMSLRKAANHPMLFRRLYDDKKIRQMAKDCLKEEEFADRNVDYIYEDMEIMTDFELHRLVKPFKILGKHALKKEEWMDAGKIHKLQSMLPEMKARGDRILIFSQFVQVLDILQQVLETMDIKFLVLTGQTHVNDRQALVDEFTEDESITCFLLSTRAGGLGLNLMAANTVIIMDMDFNPHNDKQAMDRTYRIGQKREVTIYKFVTRGTIEEDMLALADTKLALDQQVSAETAVSGDMAANLEIDEGSEGIIEKKIKTSLMSTLQKRFEGGEVDIPAEGEDGAAKVEDEDVKMEDATDTKAETDDAEGNSSKPAIKISAARGAAAKAGGRLKAEAAKREAEEAAKNAKAEAEEEEDEDEAAAAKEEANGLEEDDDDVLSSVGSDGSVYEDKE